MKTLWLIALFVTLAQPPVESSLGRYPVPPIVAMAGQPAPCLLLLVRPLVMLQRGDIRVEMRVARHADHRRLVLTWDGGAAGAGSSREQLEGDEAEVLHTRWLKSQAPGHYVFLATVLNARGRLVGRATAEIRAPEDAR
jgi:hypothetical protein